jgi:DUF4097 and DUF4098 domain-containing protein YvlB
LTFRRNDDEELVGSGLSGFIRSLLAGIPWSEHAEGIEELHFEATGHRVVRLHNANGRTRVVGEDRSDIEVVVSKTARAESSEAANRLLEEIRLTSRDVEDRLDLEIEIPRRWNRRGCANVEIRLPRKLRIEIASTNGRIDVSGLRARVRARSGNGSACISDVVGNVDVITSNAKVCCSGTSGALTARSSNGKIEIEQHRGSIDASTSNGLIRASLEVLGKRGVQLATSNGRIVLELPEVVDADVDIRIDNGIIRSDRTLVPANRESTGRLSGRLGNGGTQVKLRTSNGSISLR